MTPHLITIEGPSKGKIFLLEGETISIGRESSNEIQLGTSSVSRRHTIIKREGDDFIINDLESLNGTYVCDTPAKNHILKHGDRVKIGDYVFIFSIDEHDEIPELVESTDTKTVRIKITEAFHLMARDLSALMKISTTINSIRDLEELQQKLIELIFEVVPAQRSAIMLSEDDGEEFISTFSFDRINGVIETFQTSKTVIAQAVNEGVALLTNDLEQSDRFAKTQSLAEAQIKFVLCVPLVLFDKTLGLIYLDTNNPAETFDRDHLQLLTAIANITAVAIQNARHFSWLENENQRLRDETLTEKNMIGESEAMKKVFNLIARVAPTDSTVLIRGESGTGKELAARAIHLNSPRKEKPFVAINCAALTETLLESELFGHEKGAFTGATAQKKGKIEIADDGTLFLDEMGELAPQLQSKLLRVLQEREFERVGGTKPIKVNIRLIAATNRDLEAEVKTGKFRQDLYYRLNVVQLTMPSLRERREDIPRLADYFIKKFSAKIGHRVKGLSKEAKSCLMNYEWQGNVRELENAIERAIVLGSTEYILPEDLPESIIESSSSSNETPSEINYHDVVRETKKRLILNAVKQANGSYIDAAKLLGVHANYLHRLIRNLDLKDELKNSGY